MFGYNAHHPIYQLSFITALRIHRHKMWSTRSDEKEWGYSMAKIRELEYANHH